MASKVSKTDRLAKQLNALALTPNDDTCTVADDYYANRKEKEKTNFARLEKGLLLFIYVYETSKGKLAAEIMLWNHRACVNTIKDGKCTKPVGQCHADHQTTYRQANLCPFWYISDGCTYGEKCQYSHQLENVSQHHRYIRTLKDWTVFQLLRFVRNFTGHYIESAIADQQDLHKHIVVLMVHLVHVFSPKNVQSIDHLNLFLEKPTIDQLLSAEALLDKLEQPLLVPKVFLDFRMDFNTTWFRSGDHKQAVDFNELSPDLVALFNGILKAYYQGRLKSRGAKAAWP
jgi:hypothetical protein